MRDEIRCLSISPIPYSPIPCSPNQVPSNVLGVEELGLMEIPWRNNSTVNPETIPWPIQKKFHGQSRNGQSRNGIVVGDFIILDSTLWKSDLVTAVAKTWNYHIRVLRHIRPLQTMSVARTISYVMVTARLEYCNSMLQEHYNTTSRNCSTFRTVLLCAAWNTHSKPLLATGNALAPGATSHDINKISLLNKKPVSALPVDSLRTRSKKHSFFVDYIGQISIRQQPLELQDIPHLKSGTDWLWTLAVHLNSVSLKNLWTKLFTAIFWCFEHFFFINYDLALCPRFIACIAIAFIWHMAW